MQGRPYPLEAEREARQGYFAVDVRRSVRLLGHSAIQL